MSNYSSVALGELCNVSIGRTPRRSESRYWGGSHPWATIRDLDDDILMQTGEGITDAALNEVMPEPVAPNTLLFSFKLSIGKMAFAGQSMHHNEAIAALPIRDTGILDRKFLFYALKARTHDDAASHAVLGKVLNKRKVQEIKIPLPPLVEQQRIVAILNRAAKIERLRKQAQERLREFIPALFIKMFGDPVENSMGWEIGRLEEFVRVRGGKRLPKGSQYSKKPTPYRYVRATDITPGKVISKNSKYIGEELHCNISRYTIDSSDTLITIAGKIGIAAPADEFLAGSNLTENAARLTPQNGEKLHNVFLSAQLNSEFAQTQIRVRTGRVTIGKLALERIRSMSVLIPPISLQLRFAKIVEQAHTTSAVTEKSSIKASALSNALMSRLFAA